MSTEIKVYGGKCQQNHIYLFLKAKKFSRQRYHTVTNQEIWSCWNRNLYHNVSYIAELENILVISVTTNNFKTKPEGMVSFLMKDMEKPCSMPLFDLLQTKTRTFCFQTKIRKDQWIWWANPIHDEVALRWIVTEFELTGTFTAVFYSLYVEAFGQQVFRVTACKTPLFFCWL